MEYTEEQKQKLIKFREFYVHNFNDNEKEKLFKNLRKPTSIHKILRGYTAINKMKAHSKVSQRPYDYLFEFKYNEQLARYLDTKDLNYLISLARWTGFSQSFKILGTYKPQYVYKVFDNIIPIDNFYDFSCGWGTRLLSSLGYGINYYGTDPNKELCDNLRRMYNDYIKFTNDDTKCDIRDIGSEIFIEEWTGKMDLCFSSPPYYNVEIYEEDNENQSIYNKTYEEWLENYVTPTIQNCYKYLTDNGYLVINITNSIICPTIEEDYNKIILDNGFELIKINDYFQSPYKTNKGMKKKSEKFYWYKKKL